jgi:hypothetical protein
MTFLFLFLYLIQITYRLLVAGNVLAMLGSLGFAFATELWSMVMMRVLFGLGAELLLVAGSLLIVISYFSQVLINQ